MCNLIDNKKSKDESGKFICMNSFIYNQNDITESSLSELIDFESKLSSLIIPSNAIFSLNFNGDKTEMMTKFRGNVCIKTLLSETLKIENA